MNDILSELRSDHAPTTPSSSSVHSLFIATIALSFVKLLRATGSFLSPQPLMLSTACPISEQPRYMLAATGGSPVSSDKVATASHPCCTGQLARLSHVTPRPSSQETSLASLPLKSILRTFSSCSIGGGRAQGVSEYIKAAEMRTAFGLYKLGSFDCSPLSGRFCFLGLCSGTMGLLGSWMAGVSAAEGLVSFGPFFCSLLRLYPCWGFGNTMYKCLDEQVRGRIDGIFTSKQETTSRDPAFSSKLALILAILSH